MKKGHLLTHPVDSWEWKTIIRLHNIFGDEDHNLRLELCADRIKPFVNLSSQYNIWSALLVIYNLPPCLCMKCKYIMLSLLISGPKQPGNDNDVYLAPLVVHLRKIWDEGVFVFDAHANKEFTLRAMLLCTVNDFLAYGILSRCKNN